MNSTSQTNLFGEQRIPLDAIYNIQGIQIFQKCDKLNLTSTMFHKAGQVIRHPEKQESSISHSIC